MLVVLNNKSNLTKTEFKDYYNNLKEINRNNHTLVLCPTLLNIPLLTNEILIGSQNVSSYENGAYTGEISAEQLKSCDVSYCLVGHSERREYQKETSDNLNNKIKRLLDCNIKPILCIGESKEQRDSNIYIEVLKKQLNDALIDINPSSVVIAYEPIWSIGTGIIPTNEEIEEVFVFIKELYKDTIVLYGGSANEENIDELNRVLLIDGYLLGGVSLKPEKLELFLNKL